MEHFYTIQGEGAFTGAAAYFIRLAGCDVGCVWCDVKESWDADVHPSFSLEEIVNWPIQAGADLVVITGGEPLMHSLDDLCEALHQKGLKVNIETSGAHPLTGKYDWLCLSPKKFKAPLPEICAHADELKIIVYNKSDFTWAEQYAEQVNEHCKLYLQPEYDRMDQVMNSIIEYVKLNPKWRISLQTHKFLNIP